MVGVLYGAVSTAFAWRDGALQTLQPLPGSFQGATAEAVSADGAVVAGWSYDASGRREGAVWNSPGMPPQDLGFLPGHGSSAVEALSADGRVAAGWSSSQTDSRAFRWDGTALVDLGPLTDAAHSVSADGSIVVGSGPEGAFIWDAQHGTRLLADALLADHGVDVGGWQLDNATLVTGNGLTFAGEGHDPNGAPATWRVRLDESVCPPGPPIDLIRHDGASALLDTPNGLVVDSQQRVYVTGFISRNVARLDAPSDEFPPSPAVEVLDLKDDGPPGDTQDALLTLGVGPDDSAYYGAWERNQLMKIAPDGTRSVIFDGSGYPPIEVDNWGTASTSPLGLAIAPDGTLFVASYARVLRIDPDGSAHVLLDALQAGQHVHPGWDGFGTPFVGVALLQPGRVVVHDGSRVFVLSASSGAVVEVIDVMDHGFFGVNSLAADDGRGVWIGSIGGGLAYLSLDGAIHTVFPDAADEQISGLPSPAWRIRPVAGPDGSVFYTDGTVVVLRGGDGSWIRLLDTSTSDVFFSPIRLSRALAYRDGVLYWAGDSASAYVGRYDVQESVHLVPEPPASLGLAAGLLGLLGVGRHRARRRRHRRAKAR